MDTPIKLDNETAIPPKSPLTGTERIYIKDAATGADRQTTPDALAAHGDAASDGNTYARLDGAWDRIPAGSTGTTANAILRALGAGGFAFQESAVTLSDDNRIRGCNAVPTTADELVNKAYVDATFASLLVAIATEGGGNFSAALGHLAKNVNVTAAAVITLPDDSMPIGWNTYFYRATAGAVTFAAGGSAIINAPGTAIAGQNKGVYAIKIATSPAVYNLSGDMT